MGFLFHSSSVAQNPVAVGDIEQPLLQKLFCQVTTIKYGPMPLGSSIQKYFCERCKGEPDLGFYEKQQLRENMRSWIVGLEQVTNKQVQAWRRSEDPLHVVVMLVPLLVSLPVLPTDVCPAFTTLSLHDIATLQCQQIGKIVIDKSKVYQNI